MKKLIIGCVLALSLTPVLASAVNLEAKSVFDLLNTIEAAQLTYKETGKMFGYNSTQSCIFTSDDFIVIKNYCFPKHDYPAKSFTIISAKFGLVEFYQEQLTDTIQKRDVHINTFPEPIRKYVTGSLANSTYASVNELVKTLYYQHGPACWSTNFDYNDQVPLVRCNVNGVTDFDLWAKETQNLTADLKAYQSIFERIDAKLTQP